MFSIGAAHYGYIDSLLSFTVNGRKNRVYNNGKVRKESQTGKSQRGQTSNSARNSPQTSD